MNTTNLHTLFLRLTLTLCAILAAGLNGYADDIKTLNAIDGYYFYAASDLVCKKNTITDKFYIGDAKSEAGEILDYTTKSGLNKKNASVNVQSYNNAIAFKLASGLKCKVFVYAFHTNSSTRTLCLSKTTSSGLSSNTDSNMGNVGTVDIIGKTGFAELESEILTGSDNDYYFISGNGDPVYILGIEVVPYLDSIEIGYSGDTDVTYSSSNNSIIDTNEVYVKGKLTDSNWPSIIPTSGCDYSYGNNKILWQGNKTLSWGATAIKLGPDFFTNMNADEEIYFKFDPTSLNNCQVSICDGSWHCTYVDAQSNSSSVFTFKLPSSSDTYTYSYTNSDGEEAYETHTELEWIKNNGLIINATGCTVTEISYKGDNNEWYQVSDGLITLVDTPFSNQLSGVTISVGDYNDSSSYTLMAGKNSYNTTTDEYVAYYFPSGEYSIPRNVTSTQTSLFSVDPIKWYYKITADDMSTTTGANFGDGHFYVVGGEDKDSSYGGSVEFANGQTITVANGYKTKWAKDGVAFQIEPGVKAQVRVYINGAAGRCIALRQGGSKLSDATVVTYKQGVGSGTITTLTADVTGAEDRYFYITGYGDNGFLENNIYVVGIEVIPYLANPWVWYDYSSSDKKNKHYVIINKDTNPPYVTGFKPENVRFGGTLTDCTSLLSGDNSNPSWRNFKSSTDNTYQLDYYYANDATGTNAGANYFTVTDEGIIVLNQSKFDSKEANIYYNLEGVHAVIVDDSDGALEAYYFYPYQITEDTSTEPYSYSYSNSIKDNPSTLVVTSDLEDVLSVTLTGPRYENNFIYYDDVNTIPVPYVLFNGKDVTSSATISYTSVEFITNLENTTGSYTVDLSWTNNANSITLKDSNNTTLNPSKDIYNNALFKVNYTVDYSYDNNGTTEKMEVARSYYLVVMCPKYTFHKIGSDAKLIVGSDDNSTLTGWDSGETVNGYDEYGVYYASIAWHLMHSWSMYPEMYNTYRIEYDCYKCADKGTTSKYAQGTNKDGDYKNGTRLQPRGQSGLTDGVEITCDDSDNRYLDVRVYAKVSQSSTNTESTISEVLVSKCHYKFILFTPPTIQNKDGSEATTGGAVKTCSIITTTPVQITSASASNKDYTCKGTRYTTDGSLPMNISGDNVRTPSDDSSPFKGTIKSTHTTVFYAADFYDVLPYYTGEGGKSNDSGTNEPLAILSDKYMYIYDPGEIYSVHYDPNLIYREGNTKDGALILDSNNNVTHTSSVFTPGDAALNARIRAALKVPTKAYASGKELDEQSVHLMLGSQNVMEYRGVKNVYAFNLGGIQWTVDPDDGFDEYIDDFENPLWGGQLGPWRGWLKFFCINKYWRN